MNPICQCCGRDLEIADESEGLPAYCDACGQHSGVMCAALKEVRDGWIVTDRHARECEKRHKFFRNEVERLAHKYVVYYEDIEMPNTASAFDEILQLARALWSAADQLPATGAAEMRDRILRLIPEVGTRLIDAGVSPSFALEARSLLLALQVQIAARTEPRDAPKSKPNASSVYGRCPKCGQPGLYRERRLNGNDTCIAGHIYPSREAVSASAPKGDTAGGREE